MASSSSSLSSLSVALSGGGAAKEAKRKEEEERIKIINELGFAADTGYTAPRHVRCPAQEARGHHRKRCYYLCSTLKAHEDDVYCMKIRKWIHDGTFSHVNQHENRNHAGCDETGSSGTTIGGGGGKEQLKLNQTIKYPAETQARLTAKLVGFLIRDARPAALTP